MSEHVKSDIPFFINGDLPESRRQQVEAHLADCAACRQVANKAKSKAARQKRQALKGAVSDRVPNLLVTRLGRQIDVAQRPRQTPWGWIVFLLLVLSMGGWIVWKRMSGGLLVVKNPLVTGTVDTTTASGFAVEQSTPHSFHTEGTPASAGVPALALLPIWSGQDSAIKERRQVVIRGRGAWRALWAEMGQTDVAPRVNFGEHSVVGIFAGELPAGSYQITFGTPQEDAKIVTIPYSVKPSTESVKGTTAAAHPYGLITVPATPKRLHFSQQSS